MTTELALGEAVTIEEEQAAAAKAAAEAAKSAQVSSAGTVQNSAVSASVDDVTLLAALIQCEAGNECYEGQLAVGAVVMNRVRSGRYAGSIYGVIYQALLQTVRSPAAFRQHRKHSTVLTIRAVRHALAELLPDTRVW